MHTPDRPGPRALLRTWVTGIDYAAPAASSAPFTMRPRPSRNRTTGAGAPYSPITINLPALYLHPICPRSLSGQRAPSGASSTATGSRPRAHRSISATTAAWAALIVWITGNVREAPSETPGVAGLSGVQAAPERVVLHVLSPSVPAAEPSMESAICAPRPRLGGRY
jgi:hypothetical protein